MMDVSSEFDLGPLTWVKPEIDQALDKASQALGVYGDAGDATQLRFCRSHIHQVNGALAIVGLDGVSELTGVLEAALLALEEGRAEPASLGVIAAGVQALRAYLDELMAGEPNQPLRLADAYLALARVSGRTDAQPGDLFYPDLSLRPARREVAAIADPAQLAQRLKQARMRFQKGLLGWLKQPEAADSARQTMQDALVEIEQTQTLPAAQAFWRAAAAFLEAMGDPALRADVHVRPLVSRIDAQIRRLLEGSGGFAERLMREVLYHVARATAEDRPLVAEMQAAYRLDTLLPASAGEGRPPESAALHRLREVLMQTEELWAKVCAGSAGSMPAFAELARTVSSLTEQVGLTDLKRLGQGLAAMGGWLAEEPRRLSEGIGMEVATAILLLQDAQAHFRQLGTDFARQVDVMVARLYACIAGRLPEEESVPGLDEMMRRAQEKLLIGQVAREIQNNLAQIEQSLDAFFRDPARRADLPALDAPLRQVAGALAMLGHFPAVQRLKACGEQIQHFAAADYVPDAADFEQLARELSLIGFFVEALPGGERDFEAFARRIAGTLTVDPAEVPETEAPAERVEDQLARQARDAQAMAQALAATPDDADLQAALRDNLQSIQKDADLVADRTLGDSAKAALAALQAGEVDAAVSGLAPVTAEAPAPSPEVLQLAQASHAEIDAELLDIFLTEAREVLDTLAAARDALNEAAGAQDALTVIRRATHTLKGSGRMVGLKDLGETAWELEQTYNLWLRQEQAITPDLVGLVDAEHGLFSAWVAHLADHAGAVPDPRPLIDRARALRGEDTLAAVLPGEAAAPAVQTVALPAPEMPLEAPSTVVELDMPVVPETAATIDDDLQLSAAAEALSDLLADEPEPVVEADVAANADADADALSALAELAPPAPEAEPPAAPPAEPTVPALTLIDIFKAEAQGHLQTLQHEIDALLATPTAPTKFEMTRAAHTLGGIAGTVGLLPIHHLGIALEHALLRRDGSAHPEQPDDLETVHQAVLTLEAMLLAVSSGQTLVAQGDLLATLEGLYPPAPEAAAEAAPHEAEIIPLPRRASLSVVPDAPPPAADDDITETAAVPEPEPEPSALPADHAASALSPSPLLDALLDDVPDPQLLPIFLEEAADQLGELVAGLRAWRAHPEDNQPPKALARVLHTFKGNARMAGVMALGEFTHLLETQIEETQAAGAVGDDLLNELETAFDTLAQAVERLRNGPPPSEAALTETVAAAAAAATTAEPEADTAAQKAVLRVRADLVDRLVNEAGELSIARTRIEGEMRSLKGSLLDLTENVIRLRRQLREIEIQAETQMQARVAQAPGGDAEFDPLELDRFTRFQELTRFMAESVNDVATVQQNLLKNLDDANAAILAQARLNRSLQQELMNVRMLPFDSQAERLYRVVRQTAKELGKRAHLDITGGKVDIDRTVLDKMVAPLEHMLRNAVTHGIESVAERQAAGKADNGEITLGVAQEGSEIIITLRDDGRGLDPARLRARAEAMGLLAPGQTVDAQTLNEFIFHPGFTTADALSAVAGRGVGMDVVKTEVAALGGRIETSSEAGQGVTFRLYLPLSLAVTQTLLVRVGSRIHAIPSTMIEQVLELKEGPLAELRAQGEAQWQGNRYPFHFLPHLLGDLAAMPEMHRQYWVLLLRSGTQRVAVQVDALQGNQEVVVKNLGPQLARVVGMAGATVLGDGQVVLILNPVALASRLTQAHAVPAPVDTQAATDAPSTLPTVLVVDDSLTVRKITSRLLAREGYQVVLAKDGVEALEHLVDLQPHVILSDIEMPRMDGFDLVRNVRADARLKDIPIIMITSRTADKHRQYAIEIGADHYLGKPYDEEVLLRLVGGYCRKSAPVEG